MNRLAGIAGAMGALGAMLTRVQPYLERAGRALLDLLFPEPPRCPACLRPKEVEEPGLCPNCLESVPRAVPPICRRCGGPLRSESAQLGLCPPCRDGKRFFRLARAPAVYEGAARDYIHRFKYGGERELGEALGVLLGQFLEREPALWPVDGIVPVPLHPARLEERGFNQAAVLAKVLGDWVGRPVWTDVVQRTRPTGTQTKLPARIRRENVRGAFRVRRAAPLSGRRVLLVDDVLTSGATADEVARMLLKAGAARVNVLCVAVSAAPDGW